jgi:hypothetical protein
MMLWQVRIHELPDGEKDVSLIRGRKPVRVRKMRQIRNLEPRFDSIETEKAPGSPS